MTGGFPRLDILPPAQRRLWPQFGAVSGLGFVLYGGTGIALRLGHRQSVDFDFFTERSFQAAELFQKFAFLKDAKVVQQGPDTLTVFANPTGASQDTVKLSFFGGLDFGRLGEPDAGPDNAVEVASLHDLLSHKLKVILQRIEAKDYLDIDAILRNGVSLTQGLAGAQALFKNSFPAQEPLKALTYFEGGDLDRLPGDLKRRLVQAAADVGHIAPTQVVARRLGSR